MKYKMISRGRNEKPKISNLLTCQTVKGLQDWSTDIPVTNEVKWAKQKNSCMCT